MCFLCQQGTEYGALRQKRSVLANHRSTAFEVVNLLACMSLILVMFLSDYCLGSFSYMYDS